MEAYVFDTSALLNFGQRGRLEALLDRFRHVRRLMTTPDVVRELTDPNQRAYYESLVSAYFEVKHCTRTPFDLETIIHLNQTIDEGEISVMALAREISAVAVIDERAGRRETERLGVRLTGTLGLIYDALGYGWLTDPECLEIILRLKAGGFSVAAPAEGQSFAEYFRSY